jgi:hypothetical protein
LPPSTQSPSQRWNADCALSQAHNFASGRSTGRAGSAA